MNLCGCQCIAVCRTERRRAGEEHSAAQSAAAACHRHALICNALSAERCQAAGTRTHVLRRRGLRGTVREVSPMDQL